MARRTRQDDTQRLIDRVRVFDGDWYAAAVERVQQYNDDLNFSADHTQHPMYDRATDRGLLDGSQPHVPDMGYWRDTLAEHFANYRCDPKLHPGFARELTEQHRRHVAQAIARGEDVPEQVLADHSDLWSESHHATRHQLADARRRMAGPKPEDRAIWSDTLDHLLDFHHCDQQLEPGRARMLIQMHRTAVAQAVNQGKAVPQRVLRTYDDLAAGARERRIAGGSR